MLPKQHRLTRPSEFRGVVKAGRRRVGAAVMTHTVATGDGAPARFGFVVSKAVGGAVARNLVKRRLRHAAAECILAGFQGSDVVVRAMPVTDIAGFEQLRAELREQLGLSSSRTVTA